MTYYYSNELYHHGILGQKWGVRRFQNEDGSYKNGAEGRYDPIAVAKRTAKKIKSVSSTIQKVTKNGQRKVSSIKAKLSDPKVKKAIKVGAAIAGTAIIAYGAYRLSNQAVQKKSNNGRKLVDKIVQNQRVAISKRSAGRLAFVNAKNELKKELITSKVRTKRYEAEIKEELARQLKELEDEWS